MHTGGGLFGSPPEIQTVSPLTIGFIYVFAIKALQKQPRGKEQNTASVRFSERMLFHYFPFLSVDNYAKVRIILIDMEKKKLISNFIFKYALITLGCVIYSLGVALFLDPNNLAAGGVTGIAIMINYGVHWNVGWIIVLINVPLFVLGFIFFGKQFALSTLFSTLVSSGFIELWAFAFKQYIPIFDDLFINSVLGGMLFGIGLGLIFRMGSTTGGTDIIVKILRKKFRSMRTGVISMIIDVIIVAVSAFVYHDLVTTFYTILSIVIFTLCFDRVLYGGSTAKMVYIIAADDNLAQDICRRILTELDVGATYVDGEGAYTGKKRKVLMCAVKNYLFPKLRDIVRETDKSAFMIVSSAKEIYGEGYKRHDDEEL